MTANFIIIRTNLDPKRETRGSYLEYECGGIEEALSYRNALQERAKIEDSWMFASKADFQIYKWIGD